MDEAATRALAAMKEAGERMPGFGHRYHTKDPRTARLFELAREAGVDGAHMKAARAVEKSFADAKKAAADQCRWRDRRDPRRSGNESRGIQRHLHDRAHARIWWRMSLKNKPAKNRCAGSIRSKHRLNDGHDRAKAGKTSTRKYELKKAI